MTCCFQSSFKHVKQTGISAPKIMSLYLMKVSLKAFSSSSFVFIQFWGGIFNSFAISRNDILFIHYYFVTLGHVTKIFFVFFVCLKNSTIIIIAQHVTFSVLCIGVIYTRMIIFALLVGRVDLYHCRCIAIDAVWNVLAMKFFLCVLSLFSTYHRHICFLLLSVLLSVFQIAATKHHSKSFFTKAPTPLPLKH